MITDLYKIYFQYETQKITSEIIYALKASGRNVRLRESGFDINYSPSSLAFWLGRGVVRVSCTENDSGNTICHCEALPRLFSFDISQAILILFFGLLSYLVLQNYFSIATAVAIGFAWILMILAASYLLIFILIAATAVCFLHFSDYAFHAVLIAWGFLFLIFHLALRYNSRQLKEIFLKDLHR